MPDRRVTLREASVLLGVSEGAIRKRVKRGTIRSEMGDDGLRYVWVDAGADVGTDASSTPEPDALISAKDETIRVLSEQLEAERQAHGEARRLLAAALERIPPQLEPPSDAPGSPESTATGAGRGGVPQEPEEPVQRRSWWREFFGFGE